MVSDRMTRSRSLSKILCQKFFWIQFGVSGSGIGFLGVSVRRSMVVLEFSFFEIGPHYVWGYKTCYKLIWVQIICSKPFLKSWDKAEERRERLTSK